MNKPQTRLLLILAVLILAAIACEGSFSTANIGDTWMSFDEDGTQETTTFGQSDVFHAQVELNNAPEDTSVKAIWIAVDVEDTEPNFEIFEYEYVGSDGRIIFDLSQSSSLWPLGEYRVDIYLNGEFETSMTFYVQ